MLGNNSSIGGGKNGLKDEGLPTSMKKEAQGLFKSKNSNQMGRVLSNSGTNNQIVASLL